MWMDTTRLDMEVAGLRAKFSDCQGVDLPSVQLFSSYGRNPF